MALAKKGSIGILTSSSPIIVISSVLSSKHFNIFMISIELSSPYLLGGER